MGFFSKLLGSPSQSSSKTGLAGGKQTQDYASKIAKYGKAFILPQTQENIDRFTPIGVTGDEQTAFDRIRSGLAPTSETLGADISMLMNPYNSSVIDEINRQATGENSILKQALSEAGQFGSNRANIGAGDIDVRREGQIGQFLQDQYNKSLGIATNELPALRMQDIANLLGIGTFNRGLDTQTKQAPVTALQTAAGILSNFPSSSTSSSTGADEGILGKVGKFASGFAL